MARPTESTPRLTALEIGCAAHALHMEDRTLVSLGMRLFGVFDGVSANGGGAEVAALAVDAVHDWVAQHEAPPTTVRQAHRLLVGALTQADAVIANHNQQTGTERHPSATTAAVVLVFQPRMTPPALVAVAATIGDSRVQLLRDEQLFTLTLDHSLFADDDTGEAKARQDRLDLARSLHELEDPIDRAAFAHRNVISTALDGSGHPDARFYAFRLVAGDRLLVDSDGIHDNLNTEDLTELVSADQGPQQTATAVTDAAWEASKQDPDEVERAKPDDMSIIVVDVPDAPPGRAP